MNPLLPAPRRPFNPRVAVWFLPGAPRTSLRTPDFFARMAGAHEEEITVEPSGPDSFLGEVWVNERG